MPMCPGTRQSQPVSEANVRLSTANLLTHSPDNDDRDDDDEDDDDEDCVVAVDDDGGTDGDEDNDEYDDDDDGDDDDEDEEDDHDDDEDDADTRVGALGSLVDLQWSPVRLCGYLLVSGGPLVTESGRRIFSRVGRADSSF